MAKVKVTVTDDDGNVMGVHDYTLESELNTLSKMELSIEELRPRMLSDITKDLLEEEQKSFKKNQTRIKRELRNQNQNHKRKFSFYGEPVDDFDGQ